MRHQLNDLLLCLFAILGPSVAFLAPIRSIVPHQQVFQLYSATDNIEPPITTTTKEFDLSTALFCGGLAFDSYVEPPANSSRWERGSAGMQVAYSSSAFARQLYKGLVEISVEKITGLPETEDGAAERLLSGKGVDACLLVAIVEGQWKEDISVLEKQIYHTGVLDLSGAAHVSRSSTCWSSVTKEKAESSQKKNGKALPYFVPSTWGKGAQAVWMDGAQEPFYLYVQNPGTARLVFTVVDDQKIGQATPVGSTYKRLSDLIPESAWAPQKLIEQRKKKALAVAKSNGTVPDIPLPMWKGDLRLTSKPRKKDKNSQIMAGAAAGAYLGGPAGAVVGAAIGNFYEGSIQGTIHAKIRYLPTDLSTLPPRKTYKVEGGLPGVDWGTLYQRHIAKQPTMLNPPDLEHIFFVSHKETGATCAVYRSLEQKLIVVSFRGTCAPVDLLTDASLVQDAWVEGQDVEDQTIQKVHRGFRTSMNSIARRLKELILAIPGPNEEIAEYDMLVTGHSLGGALATLFTADIGEYGIDAGRSLPQKDPSDAWWKGVAKAFNFARTEDFAKAPPRPKSLRLYNFGSPRVGNIPFAEAFDRRVQEGKIDQAYRIVNGEDVVARMPRSVNALVLGQINYEHVGKTVLVTSEPSSNSTSLWIEGESDDSRCPVRDGVSLSSPMAEGTLLNELWEGLDEEKEESTWTDKIGILAGRVTDRMKTIKAEDLASIVGIDKSWTNREIRLIQSLFAGEAIQHHLEDKYYAGRFCLAAFVCCVSQNHLYTILFLNQGMGRASGFVTVVGEEITELGDELSDETSETVTS